MNKYMFNAKKLDNLRANPMITTVNIWWTFFQGIKSMGAKTRCFGFKLHIEHI